MGPLRVVRRLPEVSTAPSPVPRSQGARSPVSPLGLQGGASGVVGAWMPVPLWEPRGAPAPLPHRPHLQNGERRVERLTERG